MRNGQQLQFWEVTRVPILIFKRTQRFNSFSKEHSLFPSQFYDFQKIKNNSLSVATLSNDGNLLLFYNNSRNAQVPFYLIY